LCDFVLSGSEKNAIVEKVTSDIYLAVLVADSRIRDSYVIPS